jgi:hypothetical protein
MCHFFPYPFVRVMVGKRLRRVCESDKEDNRKVAVRYLN